MRITDMRDLSDESDYFGQINPANHASVTSLVCLSLAVAVNTMSPQVNPYVIHRHKYTRRSAGRELPVWLMSQPTMPGEIAGQAPPPGEMSVSTL
jgi:hypothetical protein